MNLQSRLRAIEKSQSAAGTRFTGQAYFDEWQRHHAALDAWEREFIAGRTGPFPASRLHPRENLAASESTARYSACMTARMKQLIGDTDYLPGMTEDERFRCDQMCGLMWSMDCDPNIIGGGGGEAAFSWPGWKKFHAIAFAVGPVEPEPATLDTIL